MTTSPQKRKGSAFEREVVRVLREAGHVHAERAMHFPDRGDIDGLPGFVIEVKCHKAMDLAGWMDEAIREARLPTPLAHRVVVAKRRGAIAERAYVVMELQDWARLVGDG